MEFSEENDNVAQWSSVKRRVLWHFGVQCSVPQDNRCESSAHALLYGGNKGDFRLSIISLIIEPLSSRRVALFNPKATER